MIWNTHDGYKNTHSFLSASRYHWVGYSKEKLLESYSNGLAVKKGTQLHSFAATAISLRQRLTKTKKTLNMYVNDGIGFKMDPEVLLYYSINAYGTADTISFKKDLLRIHDLKTGVTPASMKQLEVYAAFFCLEYRYSPFDIGMELRIYQSNEIVVCEPNPEDIRFVMDKVILFNDIINQRVEEGE